MNDHHPTAPPGVRFSLASLMSLMVFVCLFFGAVSFGEISGFAAFFSVGLAWCWRVRRRYYRGSLFMLFAGGASATGSLLLTRSLPSYYLTYSSLQDVTDIVILFSALVCITGGLSFLGNVFDRHA